MALPTGSGSELLQRGWFPALSSTAVYALFTGVISTTTTSNAVPTDHIITVLSVTFGERGGNPEELNMWVEYGGSSNVFLLSAQNISAYQTFVFSDKFVLRATDQLVFSTQAGANVDVSFNFIDQNWI
jgi:hypothetical protein